MSDGADTYVKAGSARIGSTYTKLYHGYRDATFAQQLRRSPQDAYLSPIDVDRESVELFSVMNENNMDYVDQEIKALSPPPADPSSDEFNESNLMHSINAYVFGNGPMVLTRYQVVS